MQYITTAERIGIEKGRKEGLEEGLEEGREEGLVKGREEGLGKGRKEKAEKTARNLISLGVLTDEQIAHATELSLEDIRRLKRETADSPDSSDSENV